MNKNTHILNKPYISQHINYQPIIYNINSNITGYDSMKGYENNITKDCLYPHKELLYVLDNNIFQNNIRKVNTNSYPAYEPFKEVKSFNPNKEPNNTDNQKYLGKFDINSGGYNNQRELRGSVKDTKMKHRNISNFAYGRF